MLYEYFRVSAVGLSKLHSILVIIKKEYLKKWEPVVNDSWHMDRFYLFYISPYKSFKNVLTDCNEGGYCISYVIEYIY